MPIVILKHIRHDEVVYGPGDEAAFDAAVEKSDPPVDLDRLREKGVIADLEDLSAEEQAEDEDAGDGEGGGKKAKTTRRRR